jgi:hypothetical protein
MNALPKEPVVNAKLLQGSVLNSYENPSSDGIPDIETDSHSADGFDDFHFGNEDAKQNNQATKPPTQAAPRARSGVCDEHLL